jgi:outer membrane protein, multidrug efflux system
MFPLPRATAFSLMLTLLAACAPWALKPLPASTLEPLSMPSHWSAGAAEDALPADATWWAHFNDPLLEDLRAQALRANPSLLQTQAALQQARALILVGAAGLQPQLGSRISAQHQASNSQSSGNLFAAGFDASWELELFGAQRSAVSAFEADAEASRAQLGAAQTSLSAEVALRYIALRGLQARLQVGQSNWASQQQTLRITDWRAQAGLLSRLELEQARSAAQQTGSLLPGLRSSVLQAQHALAVLTGQPPLALNERLQTPAPLPVPDAGLALSLPFETLRQRPDVREAEWRVRAAESRVNAADAARWPSLQLSGSLGLQALRLGSLGSGPVLSSLLAAARWPVWDGGAARAQLTAQQAALEQARGRYRSTLLTALQEVEDALVALRGDGERSLQLAEAAQAAQTAAQLAGQRFRGGLIDFQTVLSTERAQLATQDALASARTDWSADHVRLFKALGGGWRADTQQAGVR